MLCNFEKGFFNSANLETSISNNLLIYVEST